MEGYLFPLTCFGYCFVQFSISFVLVLLVMFLFWSLQGLLSAYMKQENGYGVTVERNNSLRSVLNTLLKPFSLPAFPPAKHTRGSKPVAFIKHEGAFTTLETVRFALLICLHWLLSPVTPRLALLWRRDSAIPAASFKTPSPPWTGSFHVIYFFLLLLPFRCTLLSPSASFTDLPVRAPSLPCMRCSTPARHNTCLL